MRHSTPSGKEDCEIAKDQPSMNENGSNDGEQVPVTAKWEDLEQSGDIPAPRESHTAVVWNGFIYIYGGYRTENESEHYYNDMFKFNTMSKVLLICTETGEWTEIRSKAAACWPKGGRDGHTAVVYDDRMFILGGDGGDGEDVVGNEVHIFDLKSETWQCSVPSHGFRPFSGRTQAPDTLPHGRDIALRCLETTKSFAFSANDRQGQLQVGQVDTWTHGTSRIVGTSGTAGGTGGTQTESIGPQGGVTVTGGT
eukprot:gene10254-439_t